MVPEKAWIALAFAGGQAMAVTAAPSADGGAVGLPSLVQDLLEDKHWRTVEAGLVIIEGKLYVGFQKIILLADFYRRVVEYETGVGAF